jgi:hypothetical protein
LLAACGGGHATSSSAAGDSSATSGLHGSGPAAQAAAVPAGDWTRFDYNAARTGAGPSATGITAANVGRLAVRAIRVNGVVDSSAVELHGVVVGGRRRDIAIVTTTYGRTIAFDLATGRRLWEFTPPDIDSYEGGPQVTAATPVLDPDRRYVYAASPDGMIHKIAIADGRQVTAGGWPARITFDAAREKIGGALNLSGRYVIAATGGYFGDAPTYQGHVAVIDRSSGRVTHVWNSLCSNRHRLIDPPSSCPASDSAIWARAGVVIEPGSGKLLAATGNGPWNGSTNWGDSVLELSPDAGRVLQNWTPTNQAQLDADDADLGSTAPALLPRSGGRRLAVQGGKDGHLYLLNLARLNGTGRSGRHLGGELDEIPSPGGAPIFSAPAVWRHGGRTYVFVASAGGTYAYTITGGSHPRLAVVWHAGEAGTSPVIAGGLLYVYDFSGGTLAVRSPATGRQVASLPASGGHWSSPIVIGGRIVLPTGGSTADNAGSSTIYEYYVR